MNEEPMIITHDDEVLSDKELRKDLDVQLQKLKTSSCKP